MNGRKLRIVAVGLAGAMLLGVCGCSGGKAGESGGEETYAGAGKLFEKPTDLSLVIGSSVSWPYNEDWVLWDYIQEATGARLQVNAIPDTDFNTKLSLMVASPDSLPDLIHISQKPTVDNYALSGAFLSLDDNAHRMPSYRAFWDTVPEVEREELFRQRMSGDGKIYSAPAYGTQTVSNLRTWIYRKDVFEKHGLEPPADTDALYQTAKKLKELYPESYPICFRDGILKLMEWGPSWKRDFTFDGYYDYSEGAWRYGAQEPVMKEMVEYFLKLKDEGLVPPDYITMETKSWEELMSTDRGFMTLDYVVRIDFFNVPSRQQNPDYTLALMAPPKPTVATGSQRLMKSNLNLAGYCVCNTGREQGIENAFRFLDWMYSDEGSELLSWGKEGETYQEAAGRRQFILQGDEQPQNKYGITTSGLYQRLDPAAMEAAYTEEQVAACHELLEYLEPYSNPLKWMSFSEEDQDRAAMLRDELFAYTQENLSRFLLGQTPISEWDVFQKGLEEMGVDDLLQIYTDTYRQLQEAMEKN